MAKASPPPAPHPGSRGFRRLGRTLRIGKRHLSPPSSRSRRTSRGDEVKARVEPFRARVAKANPDGARTRAIHAVYGETRRAPGAKREPLFVLSTARKRRTRRGTRRGGYYALPRVRKTRSVPRPLAWMVGLVGGFWLFVIGFVL